MSKRKTVNVMLVVPLEVHNIYKMEKLKSSDNRSLNEIYLELIIKNTKK